MVSSSCSSGGSFCGSQRWQKVLVGVLVVILVVVAAPAGPVAAAVTNDRSINFNGDTTAAAIEEHERPHRQYESYK